MRSVPWATCRGLKDNTSAGERPGRTSTRLRPQDRGQAPSNSGAQTSHLQHPKQPRGHRHAPRRGGGELFWHGHGEGKCSHFSCNSPGVAALRQHGAACSAGEPHRHKSRTSAPCRAFQAWGLPVHNPLQDLLRDLLPTNSACPGCSWGLRRAPALSSTDTRADVRLL